MLQTEEQILAILNKRISDLPLSEQEQSQLDEWMAASETNRMQYEKYMDTDALMNGFKQYYSVAKALEQKGMPSFSFYARPVKFMRRWGWAAAAALVAGVLTAVFVFQDQSSTQQELAKNSPFTTDILPGGERATLILADGSQIVLDSAKNGKLAQQGNARVVKLDSGRLAYEVQGATIGKLAFNTLNVPKGGQYALTLPDGTRVWLNAASSIKYPTVFTGKERHVEVSGEVYMEIAKNNKQPFTIKAGGTETLVLGTSININAYPDEDAIRTTLIEGSIKVTQTSTTAATILTPGQQAAIADHIEGIKVEAVDTEQILAWRNGIFSFNNADIKTIMRQLSRWYDINIVYEKGISAQRFYGEMNRNLALSQVLKGLEVSKVNFRLEGRNLIILP